jgi:hypothetical protein
MSKSDIINIPIKINNKMNKIIKYNFKLEIDHNGILISNEKYVVFPDEEFVEKNLAVISRNTTGSDTALLRFVYHIESSKELNLKQDPDDKNIYVSVSKYSYNKPNHKIIQMNGVNNFGININQIILYTDLKIDEFNIPDKSGGNIRGRNIRGRNIRGGSKDIEDIEDIEPSDTVYNIIMNPKSNVNVSKQIITNYLQKLQKINKLDLIILYSNLSAKNQDFFLELSKQFYEFI